MIRTMRWKSAKALAYLYKLRDKESGGYLWGQSLVFLVLVTPKISMPVGVVFYQPAPEISAWYKNGQSLKKQGVPQNSDRANRHRTRSIPPKNNSPCAYWRPSRPIIPRSGFTRSWRMRSMARRRLSMGPQPFSMGSKCSRKSAAIRTLGKASGTSTSQTTLPRILGRSTAYAYEAVRRWGRWSGVRGVCVRAQNETVHRGYQICRGRDLSLFDCFRPSWRTLDIVKGHTLSWLVEVFI